MSSLNLPEEFVDWDSLAYRTVPQWDSVSHMLLIAGLEDKFDVLFDVDDVIGLSSFSIAIDVLTRLGIKFERE